MALDKIEASGRTLEEAIQAAAAELGVATDGVEYEIVEEGKQGFLGLGQTPTLLTAWVKEGYVPSAPPPARPTWEEPAGLEEEAVEPVGEEEAPAAVKEEAAQPVEAVGEPGDFEAALLGVLADVLKAMDLSAKPVIKAENDEEVVVEIVGQDLAILIGKQGQTLDALQYIVSIAANKSTGDRRRVILDAEGYRDRHRELLERKAHELASAVKEAGQEAELEPQPARDRRIIHMALADDPDVYTYSEGEGDDRHVVISPKK